MSQTTTNPKLKVRLAFLYCLLELTCKLRCVFMEAITTPAGSNARETLDPLIPFIAIISMFR